MPTVGGAGKGEQSEPKFEINTGACRLLLKTWD